MVDRIDEFISNPMRVLSDGENSEPGTNQTRWMSYIKFPQIFFRLPLAKSPASGILYEIRKSIMDPLGAIAAVVLSLFTYIYFANDFICYLVGLLCPVYYLYTLLPQQPSQSVEYFIIYSHLELLTYIFRFVGLPLMYHLKILVLGCLLYSLGYRPEWLEYAYQKILLYDALALRLSKILVQKITEEYAHVKFKQKIEQNLLQKIEQNLLNKKLNKIY